jgi:raffinose/stachyose/melibiose transport system substrate-binding protein
LKTTSALRITILILIVLSSAACTRQASGPGGQSPAVLNQADVIYAVGDVVVTGDSGVKKVEIGDVLFRGQSIKTGALSECELQIGQKAAIRIEGNTVVTLDEMLLTPGQTDVGIGAAAGTVLCKVEKLTSMERFRVRTTSSVCSVRGTEFSVTVSANNDTLLAVKQGNVAIMPGTRNVEQIEAGLKIADPDVKASFAELEQAEVVVGETEEVVVTEAAAQQVESCVQEVVGAVDRITSPQAPSAEEKAALTAAVKKAAAAVRGNVKTPKPMKKESIETLQKIEDLKKRAPVKPPAQAIRTGGATAAETLPRTELGEEPAGEEPAPGATQPPNREEPAPFTVWVRNTASPDDNGPYMQWLEQGFKKDNPLVDTLWMGFEAETFDREIRTALASGSGPDVFQTYGGDELRLFASKGWLLDMTAELRGVPACEVARSLMSINGRVYGVAPVFSVAGLFYNETVLKKMGLAAPENVGEMEKIAAALKSNGIQPFACGAADNWPVLAAYMYLVNRFGGDAYQRVKERKMKLTSDPFLRAGEKIKEWAEKGYFSDTPLMESYELAVERVRQGEAAMMVSGSWLSPLFADSKRTDQIIGFRPFPTVIGGMGGPGDVMGMTSAGFTAGRSAEPRRDKVLLFMRYAMRAEARDAAPNMVYSIPGAKSGIPCIVQANTMLAKAKSIQFWWDQDLPPALREPVVETVRSFLAPETAVKDALARLDQLVAENMGPLK